MKKVLLPVLILFVSLIFSCSPTVFQPFYCENKFKEIQQKDNSIPDRFSFSAAAMVSGMPVLVKGEFKDYEKLVLSSPFGKSLLNIERQNGTLCVKAAGFRSCDSSEILSLVSMYMPQATVLTDINLLKSLISKKFNLQPNEKIECESNQLKVIRPQYTLVYEENNLRKVIYKDYTVEYGLNNEINITNGGKSLVKITISNLNFEKN
ncbi:hypothetical protein [Sulfurihydrogenibium subterraneum]|uniref:hypothetical protein n=1 Tax=Sulfurihydrogenibium subterraneum TaxID=171121 RepID=UPI00048B4DFB|nr:hypothetical protein [Sulfurihydrogenibium subterraneum]